MIKNHVGYGLRNDEKPYAHKIPPGGNWRDLSEEEQRAFMKGSFYSGGGRTMYLRRLSWDEPALTITASVMAKANCQLHPGIDDKGGDRVIFNHEPNPQDGKYSSRYLSRKRVVYWDEAAYTVLASARDASLHPGPLEDEGGDPMEYREYNVTPTLPKNGLTVAELFCGGGLMAVGLKESGFSIVWANDFDKRAVEAYRYNLGDHVVLGDITKIDPNDIPDVDVIAGGPPCQDYSIAGKGEGENGERGRLVWTYLNIIEKKQPKAFIFENVKGLVGKRHRKTFDALLEKFDEIGYVVSWRVINAWDYGVAQKRERVFIVGIRKDLGFTFEFPEPDPADYRTQVLRDVIGDLPEPNVGVNAHIQTKATTVKPSNKLSNQRQYVADWEKPARTVNTCRLDHAEIHPGPAHHNSGQPIHPTQAPRRFTVRECLRIQSVPDWYVIPETISLSAAYRIVGNGVASRVAWYLGKALSEQIIEKVNEINMRKSS